LSAIILLFNFLCIYIDTTPIMTDCKILKLLKKTKCSIREETAKNSRQT
jgi:hypothetical protein